MAKISRMADVPAKPRRRFLRFSLRALLLLVVAIGAALGWTMHKVREQGIAVAALRQVGCEIAFDKHQGNCGFANPPTRVERWRQSMGDAEPWNVYAVTGPLNDDALVHLQSLRGLRSLNCTGAGVTDAGLVHLQGQTNIERLSLAETSVTDAGLANLQGLSRLEHLDLRGTAVTDTGLRNLQGLTRLTVLQLERTRVTDAGLTRLERLTQLQYLSLNGTAVTFARELRLARALPNCKIVR